MNVLVTGGAGYIGSVTVRKLLETKQKAKPTNVFVLDNLSKGHKETLPKGVTFIKADLSTANLSSLLGKHKIDSIIHFAASIEVGEGEKNPSWFFKNNVQNSIRLLDAAVKNKVKYFVYSSSAAVYGNPTKVPIKESSSLEPTNIYGLTKLLFEKVIEEYTLNFPIKAIALRYFNASGADLQNDLGEDHNPESHLIPLILKVALGKRNDIKIFGSNYKTKDGTCLRDYIHVLDLANAHVKSLDYLKKRDSKNFSALNIGSGKGYTVKEVIDTAKHVTGRKIKSVKSSRRKGDPAVLLASPTLAKKLLNWKPLHSSIERIISDAWEWHKKHPTGYKNGG